MITGEGNESMEQRGVMKGQGKPVICHWVYASLLFGQIGVFPGGGAALRS
jgi:hypothetical protein